MPVHLGKNNLIVQTMVNNMNKEMLQQIDSRWEKLLIKRGLLEVRTFKTKTRPTELRGELTFLQHVKAQSWYYHTQYGTGFEILSVLENDDLLVSSDVLKKNIQTSMDKLIPIGLEILEGWNQLANALISFTSKGVGLGELFLPIVVRGYTKSQSQGKGDGQVNGGKTEVKKIKAGIKSQPDTQRKIQNELNQTVFENHEPGPATKGWYDWREWMDSLSIETQRSKLRKYFNELYIDRAKYDTTRCAELEQDIDKMCDKLETVRDGQDFGHVIGTYQLKWYKQMDKWDNRIVIDNEHKQFINIVDVDDLSMFPELRFNWRYRRSSEEGGDTYQCGDGFVTIGLSAPKVAKKVQSWPEFIVYTDTPEELAVKAEAARKSIKANDDFIDFVKDPTDPLYIVWQKLPRESKLEAHEIALEMIEEGKANAVIATTLIECYLNK